jgi:hypothetical protein
LGLERDQLPVLFLKLSYYVGDGLRVMMELATTTLTHQVSCVVFVKLRLEEKKKKST